MLSRRWWIIAIPTLITFLWALPALPNIVSPPETYGATLRFSAAAPPAAEHALASASNPTVGTGTYEDTNYIPWLASEYLVVNLPQWIGGTQFPVEVSRLLAEQGLDIPSDELRPAFSADSARSILVVLLGWDDADELAQIAQATITVLQTRNQDYFPQLNNTPATIIPLDEIDVIQTAAPLSVRMRPLMRIIVGLMAGIALACLAEYFDDGIRSGDDLAHLEIPLLGSIPKH